MFSGTLYISGGFWDDTRLEISTFGPNPHTGTYTVEAKLMGSSNTVCSMYQQGFPSENEAIAFPFIWLLLRESELRATPGFTTAPDAPIARWKTWGVRDHSELFYEAMLCLWWAAGTWVWKIDFWAPDLDLTPQELETLHGGWATIDPLLARMQAVERFRQMVVDLGGDESQILWIRHPETGVEIDADTRRAFIRSLGGDPDSEEEQNEIENSPPVVMPEESENAT